MSSELENQRIEIAKLRGFIPEGENNEVHVQIGLEEMHDAPFAALGKFAVDPADLLEG